MHLSGGHSLCDESLEGELFLLEIFGRRLLDLELCHGVAEGGLDLVLGAALDLERHAGVGNDFLDTGDVGFELLAGFEFLAESLIGGLELSSLYCDISL